MENRVALPHWSILKLKRVSGSRNLVELTFTLFLADGYGNGSGPFTPFWEKLIAKLNLALNPKEYVCYPPLSSFVLNVTHLPSPSLNISLISAMYTWVSGKPLEDFPSR